MRRVRGGCGREDERACGWWWWRETDGGWWMADVDWTGMGPTGTGWVGCDGREREGGSAASGVCGSQWRWDGTCGHSTGTGRGEVAVRPYRRTCVAPEAMARYFTREAPLRIGRGGAVGGAAPKARMRTGWSLTGSGQVPAAADWPHEATLP